MSKEQQGSKEVANSPALEQTKAYQAGYMAGYLNDNPNADPSIDGYLAGYMSQREGAPKDKK